MMERERDCKGSDGAESFVGYNELDPVTVLYAVHIIKRNNVHVYFNLFAGPSRNSRALVGERLCMRLYEFRNFVSKLGADIRPSLDKALGIKDKEATEGGG